jgi:hypothetical protein
MKAKAQAFFSGPMTINLREELRRIRQKSIASRKHADLVWRQLCSVVATSGSSVNAEAFMERYEDDLRFDRLPTTATARTKVILRVLEKTKVPRMREQKAKNLSDNYSIVKSLGGPEQATEIMLKLKGKKEKQTWVRQFKGVGQKYSNDIWMDIGDPDFNDSVALDSRVKAFAKALGLNDKSSKLESELLDFAKSCNLTGWELDRLIYNFGNQILRSIKSSGRDDAA